MTHCRGSSAGHSLSVAIWWKSLESLYLNNAIDTLARIISIIATNRTTRSHAVYDTCDTFELHFHTTWASLDSFRARNFIRERECGENAKRFASLIRTFFLCRYPSQLERCDGSYSRPITILHLCFIFFYSFHSISMARCRLAIQWLLVPLMAMKNKCDDVDQTTNGSTRKKSWRVCQTHEMHNGMQSWWMIWT